jgi:hypothetical protein
VTGTIVSQVPAAAAAGRATGRRRGGRARVRLAASSTPVRIKALIALLGVLSLAWGGLGAWTVAQHSSAADALAHADEPYSYDAQQLYLAIADGDVTITSVFLQDSQPLAPGQSPTSTLDSQRRFDGDIAAAGHYLAQLRNAGGSPQFTATVDGITGGLATYVGHVHDALTEYTLGLLPTGDSFTQVASEDAHLTLLPAAKQLYQDENDAVSASKGRATSLPTLVLALVAAAAALVALLVGQWWLARRTRRVLNAGLVVATAALVISCGWLAVTFGVADSDLSTAIGQGANPAEWLAQANIDVQQARGDSIVNVIARSGTATLPDDAASQDAAIGPGSGSLLGRALAAGNAQATPDVQAAIAAAPGWYAQNDEGYKDWREYKFTAEQANVLGPAFEGYTNLTKHISTATAAAQDTFTARADAGASAFGPLEAIVIAAALLMAAASAWGLSRRLAEYS